jgi:DNA-binding response OmpR family regulator
MIAQTENTSVYRPGLIVAHSDANYAAAVQRAFRRLGWDVHLAASGPEVRHLARTADTAIVLLDTRLANESGWLTCDKLIREQPHLKVILVSAEPEPGDKHFAHFVGAAGLVNQTDGLDAVLAEVCGTTLPAAS